MKRFQKVLSLCLAVLSLVTALAIPSDAIEWSGNAGGIGGTATGVTSNGFGIASTSDNLVGYRFSVVNKDGVTRNGKVIDIFRDNSEGWDAYFCRNDGRGNISGYKMSPKYNKVQWIANQYNGYSTSQATNNTYLEWYSIAFASGMPLPTGIQNWVKDYRNLNTILLYLGIGTAQDLEPGDKVLVEPLYSIGINNLWHALTVTECGVFGQSVFGPNSYGGSSTKRGTWGWIRKYTNRIFPNALYENTGMDGLWIGAYPFGSGWAIFSAMINMGYGIGVAYDTSIENGYVVKYHGNGATSGTTPNSQHVIGVEKELSPNGYKKKDYIFQGWNTQPDGSGTGYADKQIVKNLTTESNTIVNLYAQWEIDPAISIDAVVPNSNYREGTTVITSFNVTNISKDNKQFIPEDNVNVQFTVTNGNQTIASGQKTGVVIPRGGTNLVYFKWTVPTGLSNSNLNVTGQVYVGTQLMDTAVMTVSKGTASNYQTPDTDYEDHIPDDWRTAYAPARQINSASWSEWVYENGRFTKRFYQVTPSSRLTINPETGGGSMRSGYGIVLSWNVRATSTGSSYATGNMYTQPQTAYALFPEYRYRERSGNCRLLDRVSSLFQFKRNPSGDNGRLHFVPLWFPDGAYVVSGVAYDIWTPAGMLTVQDNSNAITISGDLYDDYYIGRKP